MDAVTETVSGGKIMDDLISRQAAIDTLTIDEELLKRILDDVDVVGNEREKYEWGLGLIESYIADMKDLPFAQPEKETCKDCKWEYAFGYGECHHCRRHFDDMWEMNDNE